MLSEWVVFTQPETIQLTFPPVSDRHVFYIPMSQNSKRERVFYDFLLYGFCTSSHLWGSAKNLFTSYESVHKTIFNSVFDPTISK